MPLFLSRISVPLYRSGSRRAMGCYIAENVRARVTTLQELESTTNQPINQLMNQWKISAAHCQMTNGTVINEIMN